MYAKILLPSIKNPSAKESYTYEIPTNITNQIKIGQIIYAPFGKHQKVGIISEIHSQKPEFDTKQITNILTEQDFLNEKHIQIANQLSQYYFTTPHRSINLFIPNKLLSKNWQPKINKKTNQIKISSFLNKLEKKNNIVLHQPNEEQQIIIDQITPDIKTNTPNGHLIIGPTGSGKTEIYLHLINKITDQQQALILVPEISLTPQLAQYFYNHFGTEIEVWHSELSEGEKRNAWWRIRNKEAKIIIGSRSSLFLPFQDLGIIIIDEEQAEAFKQDQTPRYHARTVAQWISQIFDCPLVLSSATPSLESYFAALKDRINLHQLTKRVGGTPMPKIKIVDMKQELQKGNFSIISEDLQNEIGKTLINNKQIVLFLNRRGFSSSLQCFECGESTNCNNCDISLTYHQNNNQNWLQCHLCGQRYDNITSCQKCHSRKIKSIGLGTQQVEEEINKIFPQARVLRADKDTTSAKHAFQTIYEQFRNHKADILIGTQMISKGLHLPKVDLVGVMLADIGLHIPDFRANEKSFQLLTQVCGRAGRSKEQGQVIIQTLSPKHPVLLSLLDNNLAEFYTKELLLRQQHNYPPSNKITKLTCTDPNQNTCINKAQRIEARLQAAGIPYLGSPALIFRQHNKYHYNIIIFANAPNRTLESLNLDASWRIDRDPLETV